MRRTRFGLAVAGALAFALLGPAGASWAPNSITIASATKAGDVLSVTGSATFVDEPFLTLGTDGIGDTLVPGQDAGGGDLTAASMSTKTNGQVQVRWTVNSLPPVTNGSPTGFVYGWTFCVNGDSNCYEVDASRMGLAAGNTTGYGLLWKCATSACVPAEQQQQGGAIPVTFDGTAKTITMALNAGSIGATPGAVITPVNLATTGPAFVGTGDLSLLTYFYNLDDGVPSIENYTVAGKQVSLAVAAPGLDPASVSYATSTVPAATGSFSAQVNVAGQSGTRTLYARACFGANNCAYATQDVTL